MSAIRPFRFSLFDYLRHGISTRHGGVSPAPYHSLNLSVSTGDSPENVSANREAFFAALGVPSSRVIGGRLTHGDRVTVFRDGESLPETYDPQARLYHSDAVLSNRPNTYFSMTFADCVPIVFADRRRGVVGAAHAGWRGTVQRIAAETVRAMVEAFGSRPEEIAVGIGPSIGPCCFSVGGDVIEAFDRAGLLHEKHAEVDDSRLDLWSINREQLLAAGVATEQIEVAGICTSCRVDEYYSHRAERGATGRFALCIGKP